MFHPNKCLRFNTSGAEESTRKPHFPSEKKDGQVKARKCVNGSIEHTWTANDGTASPTSMTESILLMTMIDAEEDRDVATVDIPNAFIQTDVNDNEDGTWVIMKIRGPLVDMLVDLAPKTYANYVTFEDKSKILYVHILKAIYGMLRSAMLFYKKLKKDLESIGFKTNPYDPCVANRMVNGKQHM